MLTSLKNNRSLSFYQKPDSPTVNKNVATFSTGVYSPLMASIAFSTQAYIDNVNQAFTQLQSSVVKRGLQYANNSIASRGGYMAENFVADSFNLDATIKRANVPLASVPESNRLASADVMYGDQEASLKFYRTYKDSANAQSNPDYGCQKRIIPTDQVTDAQKYLDDLIKTDTNKGRFEAVKIHEKTKGLIDDRIRAERGVESAPMTKAQNNDMSKSIKVDEQGKPYVDNEKISKVFEDTGVSGKVRRALNRNELHGLGIAVAIGAGVGMTISAITTLAQYGISPDSVKMAAANGLRGGLESGITSAVGYGLGRTIGQVANEAIAGVLENAGITITENISKMLNMGVVGTLTIMTFSVYQFAKLKRQGVSTREALLQTGRQALFSLSLLAVSIAAQGIWGGPAGIIVSTSIGIILISYSLADTAHQRRFAEKIRIYTIEQCRPVFSV